MGRYLVLCSVLVLWTPGPGYTQPRPAGDAAILRKAERLAQRGKSAELVSLLSRALKSKPSDAVLARYAEAALPLSVPDTARAEQSLVRAAELYLRALDRRAQPEASLPAELVLAAVWSHALRDDFARAQALAAERARADHARTLPCLRAVGALALRRNQPEVARAVLTLARGFAPSDPELASELGLVALAQGDSNAALSALAERFALDPSSLLARRDLAYALSAAGRPAEGFALLGIALDRCREEPSCLLERGRWALEAGMAAEALSATRVLLARQPEHLDGLFLSADALLAQGELDQARLVYRTILRVAPDNLRAQNALAGLDRERPDAR